MVWVEDATVNTPPPLSQSVEDERVTLVPVPWLKPHEEFVYERYLEVLEETRRAGGYKWPIIVDQATGVILDGHHRHQVSLTLKLNFVPAILVDYLNDQRISVQRWRPDLEEWNSTPPGGTPEANEIQERGNIKAPSPTEKTSGRPLLSPDEGTPTLWQGDDDLCRRAVDASTSTLSTAHTEHCMSPIDGGSGGGGGTRIPGLESEVWGNNNTDTSATFSLLDVPISSNEKRDKNNNRGRHRLAPPKEGRGPVRNTFHPVCVNGTDVVVMTTADDDVLFVVETSPHSPATGARPQQLLPSPAVVQSFPSQQESGADKVSPLIVTKQMVIQMGLVGELYPPKSSRHLMPAELYCSDVFYDFNQLRAGDPTHAIP